MDYLKYVSVRRDYIVLPEGALTNATRLRWWQPFTISSGLASPSLERAQWAIDNILVGGSDINPSTLLDTFDDGEFVCLDAAKEELDSSSYLPFFMPPNRGCFSRGELELLPQRRAHRWLLRKPFVPPVLAKQKPRQHTQHPGNPGAHSAAWIYLTI